MFMVSLSKKKQQNRRFDKRLDETFNDFVSRSNIQADNAGNNAMETQKTALQITMGMHVWSN